MNFTTLLLDGNFWSKIVTFLKENVLSSSSNLTTAEKLSLSGEMLLRGMGTVFLVLIILWGIIAVFGAVSSSAAKKSAQKDAVNPVPATASAPSENKDAVVAAIMAAIEAFRAEEGLSSRPYRVVSFKKRDVKNRRNSDD